MVLCDVYFKRFDLTKGLLFDTFSITVWYKLCHYGHSVLRVRFIFTTDEFVDRTRNFNSNASQLKPKIYEKNAPQARFFNDITCATGKTYQTNAPQARFF